MPEIAQHRAGTPHPRVVCNLDNASAAFSSRFGHDARDSESTPPAASTAVESACPLSDAAAKWFLPAVQPPMAQALQGSRRCVRQLQLIDGKRLEAFDRPPAGTLLRGANPLTSQRCGESGTRHGLPPERAWPATTSTSRARPSARPAVRIVAALGQSRRQPAAGEPREAAGWPHAPGGCFPCLRP